MANIDAKTKELAFEKELVYHLTQRGWIEGEPSKFDPNLALYPEDLIGYIEDTQADELQKVYEWHGDQTPAKLTNRIANQLDKHGTLHLLRHGVKDVMGRFQLCQFKPSFGFNPEVMDRYRKNRLRVVRQVPFDPNSHRTLDLVFFVNGIPVATAELKTEFTQGINDAVQQYRKDRKPIDSKKRRIPLLQFKKRALVHFAISTDEIRMATHLKGQNTIFFPFNKGYEMGAGNPPNPDGYPVSYFWEEILERDAWLDIVGKFIHLEKKDKQDAAGNEYTEESLIFPRYHQWDCVTKLVETAKLEGPGHPYLIQHSTGSGKSNSIAWAAHRLAGLYDDNDNKIFDSVIVITDRKVLDSQLQETIYQFEHKLGVVKKINEDSKQLAEALEAQIPIVITTLQKFPVVLERIAEWDHIDKNKIGRGMYAILVDEAHSSQTGKAANKLKYILDIGLDDDEELSAEEVLNKIMESKGPSKNISFFAFTATPKHRTIEHFGRKKTSKGLPGPFHLYSMQQAIEEGFIVDVLQNYVTYKTFVKIANAGEKKKDQEVDVAKAKRILGKYVKLHPYNISQKIAIIVEHFRENIKGLLGGKARAMVVTSSREEAVRYKLALDAYIKKMEYEDIKALVAFSGKISIAKLSPDPLTEYNMNPGLNGRSLEKAFEEEYQVLLVAEKFQTGFDQPLLCAMYVDKRLSGVATVQTLGRLNRRYPGKKTFILDFVNEADEIVAAFKPYYRKAEISGRTDPNVVNDLMDKLDNTGLYTDSEVEQFAAVYFNPSKDISQGQLIPFMKPVKDRFKNLSEEEQKLFKKDLGSFVRAYDFLSMIIPYNDPELEKKCEFARRLNTYLKIKYDDEYINLENVQLSHYRIQKTGEHNLNPTPKTGEDIGLKPGDEMGTGEVRPKKKDLLSKIIEELNELFAGENISDNDRLAFFNNVFGNVADQEIIVNQARHNTFEQFKSGDIKQKILDAVIDGMSSNQEMSKKVLQDGETQDKFINMIISSVYNELQENDSSDIFP